MRPSRMWYMGVWNVPQTNAENSVTPTIYCAQHMHQSIDKSIQLPAGLQCDPIQMAQIVQQYCSTYSSAGHGCTLECMMPTLFTSQSTTVTAYSLKTESAKTGLLSAIWSPMALRTELLALHTLYPGANEQSSWRCCNFFPLLYIKIKKQATETLCGDLIFIILDKFESSKYVLNLTYLAKMGEKVDWDFRISDLVKNPDGTDF